MWHWELAVDFEQIKALAEEISALAARLEDVSERMGLQILCDTKKAWFGENADYFAAKEVRAIDGLLETAVNLKELSVKVNEKAEQIYGLEKQNVTTAGVRTYF